MVSKVAVTGAGGRTGRLVVKRLLEAGNCEVLATVRSEKSKEELAAFLGAEATGNRCTMAIWDLLPSAPASAGQLLLSGVDALVVCTSAVPEPVPAEGGGRPTFVWKEGQAPEQVDWEGQKAQFDAAKQAGVKHVVVVSSMGGTKPDHFLNTIVSGGNILNWKRRAEQYLIASGLRYTIIHPSGLIDQPGGERKLILGVDDAPTAGPDGTAYRSVPREDVAALCAACLSLPQAANRSFDATSAPPGVGEVTKDFGALLDELKGANCDYTINSQV